MFIFCAPLAKPYRQAHEPAALPYRPSLLAGSGVRGPRGLADYSGRSSWGTGSVSCNSVFVLHLCRFLNQEELMEREAMVQNP